MLRIDHEPVTLREVWEIFQDMPKRTPLLLGFAIGVNLPLLTACNNAPVEKPEVVQTDPVTSSQTSRAAPRPEIDLAVQGRGIIDAFSALETNYTAQRSKHSRDEIFGDIRSKVLAGAQLDLASGAPTFSVSTDKKLVFNGRDYDLQNSTDLTLSAAAVELFLRNQYQRSIPPMPYEVTREGLINLGWLKDKVIIEVNDASPVMNPFALSRFARILRNLDQQRIAYPTRWQMKENIFDGGFYDHESRTGTLNVGNYSGSRFSSSLAEFYTDRYPVLNNSFKDLRSRAYQGLRELPGGSGYLFQQDYFLTNQASFNALVEKYLESGIDFRSMVDYARELGLQRDFDFLDGFYNTLWDHFGFETSYEGRWKIVFDYQVGNVVRLEDIPEEPGVNIRPEPGLKRGFYPTLMGQVALRITDGPVWVFDNLTGMAMKMWKVEEVEQVGDGKSFVKLPKAKEGWMAAPFLGGPLSSAIS